MFRAPCAHCQEVKIILYSFWYHHTCRWPSRAQVETGPLIRARSNALPDDGVTITPNHVGAE